MSQTTKSLDEIVTICYNLDMNLEAASNDPDLFGWGRFQTYHHDLVRFIADHHDSDATDWHDSWVETMIDKGWKFGPKRSAVDRTHPYLVSFAALPAKQQDRITVLVDVVKPLVAHADLIAT